MFPLPMIPKVRRAVWSTLVMGAVVSACLVPSAALGFDAADSLHEGAFVLSLQAGGGSLNQAIQAHDHGSWYVSFVPRLTCVPIEPAGSGWLRGTLEVGAEGWLQFFRAPVQTAAEGFMFVLEAGMGVSYMITPTAAITGGYRFQHLSNAGLGERNRGYNYDGGVVGVSIFFP